MACSAPKLTTASIGQLGFGLEATFSVLTVKYTRPCPCHLGPCLGFGLELEIVE